MDALYIKDSVPSSYFLARFFLLVTYHDKNLS
jgi:hypothetical protein